MDNLTNHIIINHSYSNGSRGGCYYANYYGDKLTRAQLLNEAGLIDSASPALFGGSCADAKSAVLATAERIARITGAQIVDKTSR